MPPSARKPAARKPANDGEKAADTQPAEAGAICRRCWPNGWRTDTTKHAACEHGTWQR